MLALEGKMRYVIGVLKLCKLVNMVFLVVNAYYVTCYIKRGFFFNIEFLV